MSQASAKRPFRRVLVANRGEIAVRAIRTLRDMGIESVAVFSDADRSARHVQLADHARHIGPAEAKASYLSIDRVLGAAIETDCDAVFPGYGFLSENSEFARACERRGLAFIGPPPSAIELMGSKLAARQAAIDAGVPVVPGGPASNLDEARRSATRIGFPVLLKASAGGGGKGMRLVSNAAELESGLTGATREADRAFGDGTVYIEKAIQRPRHVEVQVLGDTHGNLVHLFERDCSIQRRHQKVIEESPCPQIARETLQAMVDVALALARSVGYFSAGTVEFLLDDASQFYFLEMNTRLQVEHPVTELVTGLDLVKQMVLVAAGAKLEVEQSRLESRGHAIECRVYAEDPAMGFLPRVGRLERYREPAGPHVRIDGWIDEGSVVGSDYDPLLAKLCVWGNTRGEAIARLRRALSEYRIDGVTTNLQLLRRISEEDDFSRGDYATSYLDSHPELCKRVASPAQIVALAAAALETRRREHERFAQSPVSVWAQTED